MPPTVKAPRSSSSAVDKALDLLEALAGSDRPPRLSELSDETGMHRATAYRVLVDLVGRGWVLRAGDHYLPGPAMLQLSTGAARNSLATLCRPTMEELSHKTGLMVNLQVLESDGSRVLEVVQPDRLAVIAHLRGEKLRVDRFAGPLALVATLDPEEREPYLRAAEEAAEAGQAGNPMEGKASLRAELQRVREAGFAIELGRHQRLIGSMARAALSAKGGPICALTLVGFDADFTEPRVEELQRLLRAATDRLESEFSDFGRTRT